MEGDKAGCQLNLLRIAIETGRRLLQFYILPSRFIYRPPFIFKSTQQSKIAFAHAIQRCINV